MPYITIQDLDINKDYTAREIDLMTFKSILAKIQTFNNALKYNVDFIKQTFGEGVTVHAPSVEEPTTSKVNDLWIKILDN